MRDRPIILLARAAVALVWLYNGLWCKLLGQSPGHREIVASAAEPLGLPTTAVLWLIGLAEVLIALWTLSGHSARWCALVQTVLLVSMNAAGLLFGDHEIPEPGGMIVHNLVLIALVWLLAETPDIRRTA